MLSNEKDNTEESLERSVVPVELARLLIALNSDANIRPIRLYANTYYKKLHHLQTPFSFITA